MARTPGSLLSLEQAFRCPLNPFKRRKYATASPEGLTLTEKIVNRHTVDLPPGRRVKAGDFVTIRPRHVMTHDNTGPVISKFRDIGAKAIFNNRQPVFTLDHDVQNKSEKNLKKYANIERFAADNAIDFYPAGRGIGHQIMIEEGYAFPGVMTVASDSHSNMYGGVGCLGSPIVRTDAAALWATGKTWWQIPQMVRVELKGRLRPGVTGKDVIVALCGYFNQDEVLNCAIEFVGEGVKHLAVDERLAISNMTTEWGALVGLFPVDNVLQQWYLDLLRKLSSRGDASLPNVAERLARERIDQLDSLDLSADANANYSKTLTLDLGSLVPHVSGPNSVKVSTPLDVLASDNIAIQKAYLVSCTNSRASDLKAAANVLRGRKVAPGVEFYVAAASAVVQKDAEHAGDWQVLVDAGARLLPAGCGPCIGLGTGLLEDGEVGISATNRNYKGRMGSPKAQAYLASPAVVAASAAAGRIVGPEMLESAPESVHSGKPIYSMDSRLVASRDDTTPSAIEEIMNGFPRVFRGPLIFAPQDNLNTDALYPGKYTYQDDITPDRQAEVVMENYDPAFASLIASIRHAEPSGPAQTTTSGEGLLLASGFNFGTGSSREQAATALRNAGIPLVLAGSFGDIFKRNAINNALLCVECPQLIADLTQALAKGGQRGQGGKENELTVVTGYEIELDTSTGRISLRDGQGQERKYQAGAIGRSVQEVWLARGLEGWVRERL